MGKGGFVYRFEVTVGTGGGSFSLLALSSPSSVIHNQLGYILTPLPPIKSRPPEFRNLRVCARARARCVEQQSQLPRRPLCWRPR